MATTKLQDGGVLVAGSDMPTGDGHVLGQPFEVCMALDAKESASELTYVCTGRYRS